MRPWNWRGAFESAASEDQAEMRTVVSMRRSATIIMDTSVAVMARVRWCLVVTGRFPQAGVATDDRIAARVWRHITKRREGGAVDRSSRLYVGCVRPRNSAGRDSFAMRWDP